MERKTNARPAAPVLRPVAPGPASAAARITRGVCRHLDSLGLAPLTEVRLGNGRRADVMALAASGEILVVEVKSGPADFRADGKWAEYRPFCDGFAFAVGPDFPLALVPEDVGLLVSDGFGCAEIRPFSREAPLAPARRKAVILRFARQAAVRATAAGAPPEPAPAGEETAPDVGTRCGPNA